MKKRLLGVLMLLLLGSVAVGGFYYLTSFQPFAPDHQLYPAQSRLALRRLALIGDPVRRANFALKLLEQRMADLDCGQDETACLAAVIAFDQTLN
jgi:hypothetical protein